MMTVVQSDSTCNINHKGASMEILMKPNALLFTPSGLLVNKLIKILTSTT